MTRRPKKYPKEYIEAFKEFENLLNIAKDKHYKPGWAFYKLKDKYGKLIAQFVSKNFKEISEKNQHVGFNSNLENDLISDSPQKMVEFLSKDDILKKRKLVKENKYKNKEKYNQDRFRSDPRNFIDNSKTCPHGIPNFRICAICDPVRFKNEYGID